MRKTLTFCIPCYNSAGYMDHCITSILEGSDFADDVEIVVVDDGSSKDDTWAKAREWQERHPGIVRAIHQQNGGHGMAVQTGIRCARGAYFKVVDSDDWVDGEALAATLARLRQFIAYDVRVDLLVTNYVFEHVDDGTQKVVEYGFALPRCKVIGWQSIGHFDLSQNLMMHALCYRTEVLRESGLSLPAHTFYVDNIYAYVPLPHCRTLYYLDVDLYRYMIGREDQSVNEKVMVSRLDQQLRVTRIMMEAYHLYDDVPETRLRNYMFGHLTLMMAASSTYSKLSDAEDAQENLDALWQALRNYDPRMYRHIRYSLLGIYGNLGPKTTIVIYRIAQRVAKFN